MYTVVFEDITGWRSTAVVSASSRIEAIHKVRRDFHAYTVLSVKTFR